MTQTLPPAEAPARRTVRLGWLAFATTPVMFALGSLLGEWLLSRQGHDSSDPDLPVGVALAAGLPALVLLVAPALVGAWCGRRASGQGNPGGRTLLLTSGIVGVVLVALNLVQVVAAALGAR